MPEWSIVEILYYSLRVPRRAMGRPLYDMKITVRQNTLPAQTSNGKRKQLFESTYKESGNLGDFASDIVERADSLKVR